MSGSDPVRVFIDTNILPYAYDLDAGWKHECSQSLMHGLRQRPRPQPTG